LKALRLFDLLGGGGGVPVAVRNCRAVNRFHSEAFVLIVFVQFVLRLQV
jgi:hypothetical protein